MVAMGKIIWGVDFKKRKKEQEAENERLVRLAKEVMGLIDTAPCEYVAPEKDPA